MTKLLALLLGSTLVFSPFYLSKLTLAGLPIYLPEIPIFLATIIWAGYALIKRPTIHLPSKQITYASMLFLLGAIISTVLAGPEALGSLKSWVVLPMIFGFLTIQVFKDDRSWQFLELGLLSAITLVSITGMIELFNHPNLRVDSFFNSPNSLAMWLAPMIFLSEFGRKTSPLITRIVQVVGVAVLVATGSFGGIIAFVTALVVYVGLNFSNQISDRRMKQTLFAILLMLAVVSLTPLLNYAISPIFGHSAGARYQIWEVARVAIARNPIFGIGPGMFENFYLGAAGSILSTPLEWAVPQPHNFFLATYLSVGLIGFFGLLRVIWFTLKNAVDQKLWPIMAVFLVILIHGLIDTQYWKNDLSIIFWLGVAVSFLVFKTDRPIVDKASQPPA